MQSSYLNVCSSDYLSIVDQNSACTTYCANVANQSNCVNAVCSTSIIPTGTNPCEDVNGDPVTCGDDMINDVCDRQECLETNTETTVCTLSNEYLSFPNNLFEYCDDIQDGTTTEPILPCYTDTTNNTEVDCANCCFPQCMEESYSVGICE